MARKSRTPPSLPDLEPFHVSRLTGLAVVQVRDGAIDWNEVVAAAPPSEMRVLLHGRCWFTLPGPVVMAIDGLHGGQPVFRVDSGAGRIENDVASADLLGYQFACPRDAERRYLRECSKWCEHPPPQEDYDDVDAYDW